MAAFQTRLQTAAVMHVRIYMCMYACIAVCNDACIDAFLSMLTLSFSDCTRACIYVCDVCEYLNMYV